MKLAPATKLDKRNTALSKKIDDDVILANCDDIIIFFIYGQFGVTRKLNMCAYLRTKFHVSSIILTSFRQGWGNFILPPSQNKPLKLKNNKAYPN